MRLASWNLNGLQARTANLTRWLAERQPDVVALQELRTSKRMPLKRFADIGYHVASEGQVALLSLSPITDVAHPTGDGRTVAGSVDGVRILNTYAPNGTKAGTPAHRHKVQWLTDFALVVSSQALVEDRFALVGDLNVARHPLDVWAPENYRGRNLFSDAERAALESVVASNNLVDVFRSRHSGPGLHSWWNYAHRSFERGRGWRLDYILASPNLAEATEHAVVDVEERSRERTSDHAPLWVDLTD